MKKLTAIAITVFTWHLLSATAVATGSGDFTRDEIDRLNSGRLVSRKLSERRGDLRLVGGMSWQMIEAPAGQVWAMVNDASIYPSLLPHVAEAQPAGGREGDNRLWIRHDFGVADASYTVRFDSDPHKRILRFRLDRSRPGSLRAGWGEIQVAPLGDNRSIVYWGVMADIGSGGIRSIMRDTVQKAMLDIPRRLKKRAESGSRYGRRASKATSQGNTQSTG
jgi:hypothetical protein